MVYLRRLVFSLMFIVLSCGSHGHDRVMGALLDRFEAGEPRVSLTYHIGDAFSGETRLIIDGSGAWSLFSTVTEGRRARQWEGTLGAPRVTALARLLIDAEVWGAQPLRRAGDDDPLASITLRDSDGETTQTVAVPASQTQAVAQFAAAQAPLLELARELSHGAVLEVGR